MTQVYTLYLYYMSSDSDWQWACEVVGVDPYHTWSQAQWDYWHALMED